MAHLKQIIIHSDMHENCLKYVSFLSMTSYSVVYIYICVCISISIFSYLSGASEVLAKHGPRVGVVADAGHKPRIAHLHTNRHGHKRMLEDGSARKG